jgi:hypothetical protein
MLLCGEAPGQQSTMKTPRTKGLGGSGQGGGRGLNEPFSGLLAQQSLQKPLDRIFTKNSIGPI